MDTEAAGEFGYSGAGTPASESDTLLVGDGTKKPFYRARPLW